MLQKCFQNIFIIGSIISICILPLLIYLSKFKSKYNIKHIYKIFIIITAILFLPILNYDFKVNNKVEQNYDNFVLDNIQTDNITEDISENSAQIIEVENYNTFKNNIEIKNNTIYKISIYLPYIWLFGMIGTLLYYLIVYKIYIYNLKIVFNSNQEIDNMINNIKSKMKIKSKINYAFSKKITTPISIGILKKKIIIPSESCNYTDLEYILKHEIFHIKNKDIEYKFILLILNCIYWFNPIIYYFTNIIDEILELNCDYNILEKENSIYRIEYGKVLLRQIEINRVKQDKFVMNFSGSRKKMMERFSNIVNDTKKKKCIVVTTILCTLIIVSLLLMVFAPNVNISTTDDEKIQDDVVLEENNIDANTIITENINEENNDSINPVMNTTLEISLIEPLNGEITSRFGSRDSGTHTGLDIETSSGTPIKATATGTVIYAGWKGSYGNLVIIQHTDSIQTYYAHCSELYVTENQTVNQGDIIAAVGSTGNSTVLHLHFEVRINGITQDPQNYLYSE